MLTDALCDKTVGFNELANSIAVETFMMLHVGVLFKMEKDLGAPSVVLVHWKNT